MIRTVTHNKRIGAINISGKREHLLYGLRQLMFGYKKVMVSTKKKKGWTRLDVAGCGSASVNGIFLDLICLEGWKKYFGSARKVWFKRIRK